MATGPSRDRSGGPGQRRTGRSGTHGMTGKRAGRENRRVLITGGSGFIGTNLAHRLLSSGQPVLLFDNLARPGVEQNLRWLHDTHGNLVDIMIADVRDQ